VALEASVCLFLMMMRWWERATCSRAHNAHAWVSLHSWEIGQIFGEDVRESGEGSDGGKGVGKDLVGQRCVWLGGYGPRREAVEPSRIHTVLVPSASSKLVVHMETDSGLLLRVDRGTSASVTCSWYVRCPQTPPPLPAARGASR
jgi:hypothetical protein